ncbi:anthrone oxygenase family protein [Luteipulveratus flavus]|uniref:DUF1772 domain-containing protein n=1 Tax=Luteipulveratus flavus TaxID=3031728 RepID=A0ABT6C2U5_9MICO|nr:anthrone oxygenase family protein [Luteipulveratus sp. YIM 133296]MDF8263025.1 DUF1772 domain-containing protein [Luteipulveratus sp. YIM 133296]
MSHRTAIGLTLLAVTLTAAIFGFFYAWVCSTMWGLDDADPRVAVSAMRAMNDSVRNGVFAPAFFGTPVALALAAIAARSAGSRRAAALLGVAAAVYLLGGLVLTMTVNVPMNEDLARGELPATYAAADARWDDYSPTWQRFNQLRTALSGVALVLALTGLISLARDDGARPSPGGVGRARRGFVRISR